MSIVVRSVIVASAAMTGVSVASARSPSLTNDNGRLLSDLPQINTPQSTRAFWQVMQRNGD